MPRLLAIYCMRVLSRTASDLLNRRHDAQVHQSTYASPSTLPANSLFTYSFPDEMQQKLGEDSIWVYEILR
jgi:hypothetical protein